MELEKIRELLRMVEESGIQELELSNRGETIRIAKAAAGGASVVNGTAPAAAAPAPAAPAPAPAAEAPAASTGREVTSPMVGTYYASPSPDSGPYVKTGDRVSKGEVLCIVEAMKLMNEIEAEFGGVVREILVENGQPVEYGQPLFVIDPS